MQYTLSNPEPPAAPLVPQAKGESDRAFEAFRAYLQLGPTRRLSTVARQVGAGLRTVERWAADFDWRGRIKTYTADAVADFAITEKAVQRDAFLDASARAKAFRDRQYALAEALLDTAERYLENLPLDDLDRLSFADACKAMEAASRLALQAGITSDSSLQSDATQSLRDQLTSLLDQAYGTPVTSASPSSSSSAS